LQEKDITAVDLGGFFEQLFAGWVIERKTLLTSRPLLVFNKRVAIVIESKVSVVWPLTVGTPVQI
jgi:hypothetical protein